MGANSELFLGLKESQLYSQDFTKKDAMLTGQKMIETIIESGEVNLMEFGANLVRLHTVVDTAFKLLKPHLPEENSFGIETKRVNGRMMPQFDEDEVWVQLNKDLKEREELLKLALKQDVIDSYGNNVPKISVKYSTDSLTIKF